MGSKVLGIYQRLSLAEKFFPKTTPASKKFKKMTKYSFFCKFFTRYDSLGNFELSHILGWGLAGLSFDKYQIAQTLQGRSCILCFETVLGMNKITPTPNPGPSHSPKIKKFPKTFFYLNDNLKKFI